MQSLRTCIAWVEALFFLSYCKMIAVVYVLQE